MSNAKIAVSSQIHNHDLRKLVDSMTQMLKLSAVQAMNSRLNGNVYKFRPKAIKVGKKKALEYPTVASVVAKRMDKLDQAGKRNVASVLGRDMAITSAIRTIGLDMRSGKAVHEQMDVKRHFGFINGESFSKKAVEKMVEDVSEGSEPQSAVGVRDALVGELSAVAGRFGGAVSAKTIEAIMKAIEAAREAEAVAAATAAKLNKGLKFRMHQVKCIDETNPEWGGGDEIHCGGAAVDDKGTSARINEFHVRDGFDDGESKNYSPPMTVKEFALDGKGYPKTFMVALALAEKDSGGFASFLQELYEAVKAEIQAIMTALGAAAGAYIGAEIGGSIGTAIGGPLGTIIGVAAGAIIGALVGWLISALKDDIFEPQASNLVLPSGDCTFSNGGLVSPAMYLHYRGHGGHYRIKYDWVISR